MAPYRVLILDDDEEERTLLVASLRDAHQFQVETPPLATAHATLATAVGFDAVLVSHSFLNEDRHGLLDAFRTRCPDAAVILLADRAGEDAIATALRHGADNYLLRQAKDSLRVPLALQAALGWARERTESERIRSRLRHLLDDIRIGVFRTDVRGRVLEANTAALRILGYGTLDELKTDRLANRYRHSEDRRRLAAHLRRDGYARDFETDMTRADGSPLRVSMSVRLDGDAAVDGLIEDISERHQAQMALAHSEAELRALVAALPDLVMILDRDGRYLQIAPNNPALLVRPAAEMLGKTVHEFLTPERAEETIKLLRDSLEAETTVSHDYSIDIDGLTHWFHCSFTPVSPESAIVVARDVTKEWEARRQREADEMRFRALIENSRDAITLLDAEGGFLFQSPSATRITGYRLEDLAGRSAFSLIHPDDRASAQRTFQDALAAPGKPVSVTNRLRHRHGEWRTYEFDGVNWLDHPAIGAVVLNYRDVTHRIESERLARESAERLDLALEAASGAAWDLDLASGEMKYSARWALLLGYDPGEVGNDAMAWEQRVHPDDREAVARARAAHVAGRLSVYEMEHRLRAKDGSWTWVLDRGRIVSWDSEGRPLRMVGVLTDLSERKRLEAQLAQAQRLEAVGQLAGGIAHDFNNVLTAILSTSELLLLELAPTDPHREDLEEIKRAANRAASLTRQLLAYSRRQVLQPKVTDLNTVVGNVDRMLRRLLGEQCTLVLQLAPALGRVRVDQGQIEQVLVNLTVNARDAMPSGGQLTISTADLDRLPGEPDSSSHDAYVVLEVTDTGTGMDDQTTAHIFEPFFTTKRRGEGTGLGLATVYGIVRQSGGVIRVASAPGTGSTFRIFLPRVSDEAEGPPADLPVSGQIRGQEQTGTVLLVEDEEAVRRLARRILTRAGYTVLSAAEAEEAVEIAAEVTGPIDLLVTDVVMPGRTGVELAQQLSLARPGLPVLFISGYPETTRGRRQMPERVGALLQKPFTPAQLVDAVSAALAARRTTDG